MKLSFSIIKFTFITFLLFVSIDFLAGKYIYNKFIRTGFVDMDTSFAIRDDVYDHKFSPSFKGISGWGNIRVEYCTDTNGFRSSCENQYRNLKKFDIGFLGDSFTEAVGVDFNKSFVGIISANLQNKKIANLAVSSYSPSIYFAKSNFLLSQGYKFNEIIVFVDIGDIVDDTVCYELDENVVKRRETYKYCFRENNERQKKIIKYLQRKFKLSYELYSQIKIRLVKYGLLSYQLSDSQINHPRSNWIRNYQSKNYNNYTYDEASNILLFNMKKLAILLKNNNVALSIAVYPWPGTLKYDSENNKHLKLWKNFCVLNCKNFYNLMKPFYNLLEKEDATYIIRKYYIKNDVHFNKEGNKFIAENFLKFYKN